MSDFDAFWSAYPSRRPHEHRAKPAAVTFHRAVKAGANPQDLIEGAKRYAAYVRDHGVEPQWVCSAARWITEEGWTQYLEPEPVKPEISQETREKMRAMSCAAMIKTGQYLPGLTDQYVNQLVSKGYLTPAEAERVGYALPKPRLRAVD